MQEPQADGQTREMLTAHLLQAAIRSESSERYDAFAKLANDRVLIELHDLLELVPAPDPVPVDDGNGRDGDVEETPDELRDPVSIALRMQDAGARAFTLHARTRTQMFGGRADWDEIAEVTEALDIPVIGNGDIQTADDVVRMRQHTGCAGIMMPGLFDPPARHAPSCDSILPSS